MHLVSFSPYRCVEYSDPTLFENRIGRWLAIREAENSHILGNLPDLCQKAASRIPLGVRLFAVEDGNAIMAAAMLYDTGGLCLTWSSPEMIQTMATGLYNKRCGISTVYAPAHVSWMFAKVWAEMTGNRFEIGRAERVYQLARLTHTPSPTGRLELATPAEARMLDPWMHGFVREAEFEPKEATPEQLVDFLISQQRLYLWKDPEPKAMAAWFNPTPRGACINFVFTPAQHRGRGNGKSVVSALGQRMLNSGLKYCFILTDPDDQRTNHLYQSIGARTLCELLMCMIRPPQLPNLVTQAPSLMML